MQQETPQNQPVPQEPQLPPTPTPPQGQPGQNFYQPTTPAPAPFVAPAPEHSLSPLHAAPAHAPEPPQALTWEASEYVHTDKGSMWLVGLGAVTLVVAGIAVYFQAWTFLILVLVMGVAMGVFAFRPPRTVHYVLNDSGVQIGGKLYHYSDFRAFGILEDGAFFTMELIPAKRFAPALSVYFAEAQGEDIVDIVGSHLPMENIQPDVIDHIMRRLRF